MISSFHTYKNEYISYFIALALVLAMTLTGRLEADPVVGCVDSSSYPIKICYDGEEDLTLAEEVLPMVEELWALFIDGLGFTVPWRLDDEGVPEQGLYILLTDLGENVAGTAIPLADVPSTPHSDCATRIEMNSNSSSRRIGTTLSHELGHTLLMADDCVETLHNGFSMYMSVIDRKNSTDFPFEMFLNYAGRFYFSTFQSNPYFALDYANYWDPDMATYVYGQAIFYMYVDERFGDGWGGIFAEIAHASRQDGTVVISDMIPGLESGENEPDLYDAMDTVLADGDGSFWDAVKEFSIWRIFTGEIADYGHLEYGASLPGLVFDDTYEMFELPRSGIPPVNPPAETGSTYINVFVDGTAVTEPEDLIQFYLNSAESMNWYLAAVIFNNDGTNRLVEQDVTEGTGRVLANDLASVSNVLFVATNLGDLVHDPDDEEFGGNNFTYDIDFYTAPTISGVTPQELTQGDVGVELEISGSGFKPDILVDVEEGITVTNKVVTAEGNKITATIDVALDAALGWHVLRTYYENGLEAQLDEAIEVQSGEPPVIASVNPDSAYPGRRLNIEITGERFQPGLTAAISGEGITLSQGITLSRVDWVNEGSIIAGIEIADTTMPGERDVTVTNPDLKSFTLTGGFTVRSSEDAGDEDGIGESEGGCSCRIEAENDAKGGPIALLLLFFAAGFVMVISRLKKSGRKTDMPRRIKTLLGGFFLMILLFSAAPAKAESNDHDIAAKINMIYELLFPDVSGKSPAPGIAVRSYTMNRVEAFRIFKTLPENKQKDLGDLFAPPVPLDCLESETLPIRSCYNDESEIPNAEAVLAWAEEAWQLEINDLGFWVPIAARPDGPSEGMDFYLGDTASIGASGYTSPEDYYDPTPHSDCTAYIVIDERMNPDDETWLTVVGHELNHGCQMAMDCSETLTSMESTATWMESVLIPGSYMYFSYAVEAFQNEPQLSLGYSPYNSLYPYGVALFIQFIQEFIGNNDPTSIVTLWEGTVQESWDNEPDLFDAAIDLAQENGIDYNTFLSTFGEWRYFVGSNDDGQHFEHGGEWWGVDVALDGTLAVTTPSRFPLSLTGDIHPLGYLFERVHMNDATIPPGKLLISFQGNVASSWDTELWLIKDGTLDERIAAYSDENSRTELLTESENIFASDDVIFMAINLGNEVDWDQSWRFEHFASSFDYLFYPIINTVTPETLYLGEQSEVTISGEYFETGLEVQISGEGVEITSTDVMSEQEVKINVTVHHDASPGLRDVIVNNYEDYEGFEVSMPDAIEITEPPPPEITAVDPTGAEPGEYSIVRIDGNNFSEDNYAMFSCGSVSIIRIDFVDTSTLYVHLDISASAEEQSCDVTVGDTFDHFATLSNAFSISFFGPSPDGETEVGLVDASGGSCGCTFVK